MIELVQTGTWRGRGESREQRQAAAASGGGTVSYLVPRVDVSTICDEYLCGLKVTTPTDQVERCVLLLAQAGKEYDAEGWP